MRDNITANFHKLNRMEFGKEIDSNKTDHKKVASSLH